MTNEQDGDWDQPQTPSFDDQRSAMVDVIARITLGDIAVRQHILEWMRKIAGEVNQLANRCNKLSIKAGRTPKRRDEIEQVQESIKNLSRLTEAVAEDKGSRGDYDLVVNEGDAKFLQLAKNQLEQQDFHGQRTMAASARDVILKHLNCVQQPAPKQRDQEQPDVNSIPREVYFLSSHEAGNLVESSTKIDAPVFVHDAQSFSWKIFSGTRPIEQLLSRMPDPDDKLAYRCQQCPRDHAFFESFEARELQQRFGKNEQATYTINIVDLPSPLPCELLPDYLTSPNCRFLTELKRAIDKSDAISDSHMVELQQHFRQHQQVFLLAEAGALSPPHYDPFGYGTWIACQEGEMGFAWLSHPTDKDIDAWRKDEDGYCEKGRWLYKVLRQGDSTYLVLAPCTLSSAFQMVNRL